MESNELEITPIPRSSEFNRARFLGALLEIGGVVVGLLAAGWGIQRIVWLSQNTLDTAARTSEFLIALIVLAGGLAVGLVLWTLAEVARRTDVAQRSLAEIERLAALRTGGSSVAPAQSSTASSANSTPPLLQELVNLMREVRDLSMLSESQRAARLELQAANLAEELEAAVPALLREHNWVEARRRVREARVRFPQLSRWDSLEIQIERVRSQVEARDIESAARQVNDLATLGAWARASEVVHDLLSRHPDAPGARQLAKRVRSERERAEAEQRARLLARAQDAASRRDWAEALSTANAILERYPSSPEAEALRQQIHVLRENAEIQARQRMEQEFRELIRLHRYDEALELARRVVHEYPDSPQSIALRTQIPRLEQMAMSV